MLLMCRQLIACGRTRPRGIASLLCALAFLLAAGPGLAESPDDFQLSESEVETRRFGLLDSPAWLAVVHGRDSVIQSLRIDEVYGASGGQYASDLISVFKIKLEKIFEPGRVPLVTNFFRPYVLGGQDNIRVANPGQVGRAIPGSENCTALHIGGGGDFYLSRRFVLSLDYSQVLHTGSLSRTNYSKLQAGLRFHY
jgi:hypothetical protein